MNISQGVSQFEKDKMWINVSFSWGNTELDENFLKVEEYMNSQIKNSHHAPEKKNKWITIGCYLRIKLKYPESRIKNKLGWPYKLSQQIQIPEDSNLVIKSTEADRLRPGNSIAILYIWLVLHFY